STQALELVATPSGDPLVHGSVRLGPVTGDASLSLTNPLNTDANTTRQTVVLDALTAGWDVAGSLAIESSTANLEVKGAIIAETVSIAAAGAVTMNNGTASIETDVAGKALSVSGGTGVELGTLTSLGTVTVSSSAGSILDKRADTTTNILTTGDVVLSARSIGSGGVGAVDIDAAKLASVTTTSTNAGAAYLRLTATDGGVELEDASVTGVLSVIAPNANLTVSGAVAARSLVLNTTPVGAGVFNIAQTAGSTISVIDTASVTASGDLALEKISGSSGAMTLRAEGVVTGNAGVTGAHLTSGTGNLTIEADRIGSTAQALKLDARNIASLSTREADVAVDALVIESTGLSSLSSLDTRAGAVFSHTGSLTLAGSVLADRLGLSVAATSGSTTDGSLTQVVGSRVLIGDDLDLTVARDVTLTGMTSLTGDIAVTAGGAIVDGTADTERTLLTTATAGKTITLSAASIGGLGNADIDIQTDTLTNVTATAGDAVVSSAGALSLGALTATGVGTVVVEAGNLTTAGALSAREVNLTTASGSVTMGAASTVTAIDRVTMSATGGDLALRQVSTTGTGEGAGTISLTASGALTAVGSTIPHVNATNNVTISATTVGSAAQSLGVKAPTLARLTATGDVYLLVSEQTAGEDFRVGQANVTGRLTMSQATGNLVLTDAMTASQAVLTATDGDFTMIDGVTLTVIDAATIMAGDDVNLSRIISANGPLSITAGQKILDGTASELANITGQSNLAVLSMSAAQVGEFRPQNSRQQLVLDDLDGGTFTMTVVVDGRAFVTDAVAFDATDTEIRAALLAASYLDPLTDETSTLASLTADFVVATDSTTGVRSVTFDGVLGDRDMPLIQIDKTNLLGSTDALAAVQATLLDEGSPNVADVNISVGSLNGFNVTGDVYLRSARALTIDDLTASGVFELDVEEGDLTLRGTQQVGRVRIGVEAANLIQTTTGELIANNATTTRSELRALNNLTLNRVQAVDGDLLIESITGSVLNQVGATNTAGDEAVAVDSGRLTVIADQAIGTRFQGGALTVDATDIALLNAIQGGIFVAATGDVATTTQIDRIEATAVDADSVIQVLNGNVRIDTLLSADVATVRAGGVTGENAITLGRTEAGGHLTVAATLGNITQLAGTRILADGTGARTSLSAGGDITLTSTTNDFRILEILDATNATLVEKDVVSLDTSSIRQTATLTAGDAVDTLATANFVAGEDVVITLQDGDLTFGGDSKIQAGRDALVTLQGGGASARTSGTLLAGRDVNLTALGSVNLGGTVTIQGGDDVVMDITGELTSSDQLTVKAVAGSTTIQSISEGNVSLAGTTQISGQTGVTIALANGSLTATGSTSMTSAAGATAITLSEGRATVSGATTIQGTAVTLTQQSVSTAPGLTTSGTTSISATSTDVTLALNDALRFAGATTVTANRDADVTVATGGALFTNTSQIRATTGSVGLDVV
ncbi:MAG: hypothetical protein EBS76_07085, partial [Actinobacteria bacterium]|nr:hypothetical protein [Actinomycetota bacterium]